MQRSSRASVLGASASVMLVLMSCSGGGDGSRATPPDYVQADIAGTWDSVTFEVGTQPGWARRYSMSIDGAGNLGGWTFLDDLGNNVELSPAIVLKVGGAGDLTRTVAGASDTFRGFLGRNRNLIAGVSTPGVGSFDLTIARKRDVVTTFDASDIGSRAISIHTLREGADGWRYAEGTIDPDGLVSVEVTMGPAFATSTVYSPPPPHGATLSVDAEGFVSDGAQFQGFLTMDKSAIVAVHTDGAALALTVIALKGGSFAQADLAGTWAFSSLAGNVQPTWFTGKLAIDAAGGATYLSQLEGATGSTTLPTGTTFHLDPDGLMTSSTNPSYRGTLALDGDTYVRTQTHSVPGRYGIGVAMRR
jgi:hypothetical protein